MGSFEVMTQGERIKALEVKVDSLEDTIQKMDGKIDELLALRNKGAGVFWLIITLMGTGLVGGVVQFLDWVRN